MSSLPNDISVAESGSTEQWLPVQVLRPDPENVRRVYSEQGIEELAASIETVGQIHPLVVYPIDRQTYMVLSGHRRLRAFTKMQARSDSAVLVKCTITDRPRTEKERIQRQAAENLHTEPLNPLDVARIYRKWIDMGFNQVQTARDHHTSQPLVSQYLRLLDMSPLLQKAVEEGTMGVYAALEADKKDRAAGGKIRTDYGRHKINSSSGYFGLEHRLNTRATEICTEIPSHLKHQKYGTACGECFLTAHAEELGFAGVAAAARPEARYAEFNDIRPAMAALHCSRCNASGPESLSKRCSRIESTDSGDRLVFYPNHHFRIAITGA